MWVSVENYVKLTNLSRSAVYKQMREKKLKTRKDKKGHAQIYVKKENTDSALDIIISNNNKSTAVNDLLAKLEGSHNREIESLKEQFQAIIKMKDQRISELEKEVREFKEKKGLLRLFK
jgi:hypothetical protein